MHRLLFVVVLAIILIASPLLVLSDTAISTAGTDIRHNEATSSVSEAGNSSASATITITMTGDAG